MADSIPASGRRLHSLEDSLTTLQSSTDLESLIRRNRQGEQIGTYAVCSAHPTVLDAAIQQALEDGSILHVESTSSQVNQLGGYTGQVPQQFADNIHSAARQAGLSSQQVLLGGDHLGPFPWRNEPSQIAMDKACALVRACVLAGYTKIHLDASMACADDNGPGLDEQLIAARAALLCDAAERAHTELPTGSAQLVYVIGSEVPAPGGESEPGEPPAVTPIENVKRTLEAFKTAFAKRGLSAAWERVIGLVVQPGVEFGDEVVFNYDRSKANSLSSALPKHPYLAYEAHSTDYQPASALQTNGRRSLRNFKSWALAHLCVSRSCFCLECDRAGIVSAEKGCSLLTSAGSSRGSNAGQSEVLEVLLSRRRNYGAPGACI